MQQSEDENCESEDRSTVMAKGLLYLLLHHTCPSVLTELNTPVKVTLSMIKVNVTPCSLIQSRTVQCCTCVDEHPAVEVKKKKDKI